MSEPSKFLRERIEKELMEKISWDTGRVVWVDLETKSGYIEKTSGGGVGFHITDVEDVSPDDSAEFQEAALRQCDQKMVHFKEEEDDLGGKYAASISVLDL